MSKPFPPLYEPGLPPLPLFVLTSQTDIFYNPLRSTTITANEELPLNLRTQRHRSVPPISKSSGVVRFHSVPASRNDSAPEDSDSSLSSLSSDSGSDTDEADEDGNKKIPKPAGEAGRPGRGGYTLRVALGWNARNHKKLQVCIITSPMPNTLTWTCRAMSSRKWMKCSIPAKAMHPRSLVPWA
jgi:hypothetical protein